MKKVPFYLSQVVLYEKALTLALDCSFEIYASGYCAKQFLHLGTVV